MTGILGKNSQGSLTMKYYSYVRFGWFEKNNKKITSLERRDFISGQYSTNKDIILISTKLIS